MDLQLRKHQKSLFIGGGGVFGLCGYATEFLNDVYVSVNIDYLVTSGGK